MNYQDIVVVEDFEEAEHFRYEHIDDPVELFTPVGYEASIKSMKGLPWFGLICFDGIYFKEDE